MPPNHALQGDTAQGVVQGSCSAIQVETVLLEEPDGVLTRVQHPDECRFLTNGGAQELIGHSLQSCPRHDVDGGKFQGGRRLCWWHASCHDNPNDRTVVIKHPELSALIVELPPLLNR